MNRTPTPRTSEVTRGDEAPYRIRSSLYAALSSPSGSPPFLRLSPLGGREQVSRPTPHTPPVMRIPNTFIDRGLGESVSIEERRSKWISPSTGREAEHERLSQQLLNERRSNLAASTSTCRRSLREQHPVPSPAADRDHTQSVSSMCGQPDTPSYQNRILTRTFQHPPLNTDWGNVPTATQSLLYTNS
jgi:hypothetical protein